ncbi:MAG: biotin synthase BioB [Verrucomicrobiae bacterium]|nr:biotin synthase BioB [Verrucomicrobiae bacterium]
MIDNTLPAISPASIAQRIIAGGEITREEALTLIELEDQADIMDLISAANRVRRHFKGDKIHLCSIVNAKAGACSEDCKFCAQSARYNTDAPVYKFMEWEKIEPHALEAQKNGAQALGIVTAWKGLKEGPLLDEVCDRIEKLSKTGVRADASLGILENQEVADKLARAGLKCCNHNLETAEDFFGEICSTHTYEDRIRTLGYLRKAGIKLCSGGIFGMGETRGQRVTLAFALREQEVFIVPMNFLNPIGGTPLGDRPPLAPYEILKTIAVFRLILPRQEIMVAGGREVNLRDLQPMIFPAGASALMVGNYLTTSGQNAEKDLQMIRDLGLDPQWGTIHG